MQAELEHYLEQIKQKINTVNSQDSQVYKVKTSKLLNPINLFKFLTSSMMAKNYIFLFSLFISLNYLWFFPPVQSFWFDFGIIGLGLFCATVILFKIAERLENAYMSNLLDKFELFLEATSPKAPKITVNSQETDRDIILTFFQNDQAIYRVNFDHRPYSLEDIQDFALQIEEIISNQKVDIPDVKESLTKSDVFQSVLGNNFQTNSKNHVLLQYLGIHKDIPLNAGEKGKVSTIYKFNDRLLFTLLILSVVSFIAGIAMKTVASETTQYQGDQDIHSFIQQHKFETAPTLPEFKKMIDSKKGTYEYSDKIQKVEIKAICNKQTVQNFLVKYEIKQRGDKYYTYAFAPNGNLVSSLTYTPDSNESKIIDKTCQLSS